MKNLNTYCFLILLVCLTGSCKKKEVKILGIAVAPSEVKIHEELDLSVEFSSQTEISQLTCAWDFGDGATGTGFKVSHVYQHPGKYKVKVVVNNNAKYTASTDVTIKSNCLFHFTGVPLPGEAIRFYFVNFMAAGSSCKWDLGDGTFSTDTMPSHVYAASGTYNVSVIVDNDPSQTRTYPVTIFSDPLYTHLISGMRLWHGLTYEFSPYDSAGTATSFNPRDSSFEISYVNPITVNAGLSKLYYNPFLSYSDVLAFTYDGSNPDGRGTVIYFNHVSDSIWIKSYYPTASSTGIGHFQPPIRYARWHTP